MLSLELGLCVVPRLQIKCMDRWTAPSLSVTFTLVGDATCFLATGCGSRTFSRRPRQWCHHTQLSTLLLSAVHPVVLYTYNQPSTAPLQAGSCVHSLRACAGYGEGYPASVEQRTRGEQGQVERGSTTAAQ